MRFVGEKSPLLGMNGSSSVSFHRGKDPGANIVRRRCSWNDATTKVPDSRAPFRETSTEEMACNKSPWSAVPRPIGDDRGMCEAPIIWTRMEQSFAGDAAAARCRRGGLRARLGCRAVSAPSAAVARSFGMGAPSLITAATGQAAPRRCRPRSAAALWILSTKARIRASFLSAPPSSASPSSSEPAPSSASSASSKCSETFKAARRSADAAAPGSGCARLAFKRRPRWASRCSASATAASDCAKASVAGMGLENKDGCARRKTRARCRVDDVVRSKSSKAAPTFCKPAPGRRKAKRWRSSFARKRPVSPAPRLNCAASRREALRGSLGSKNGVASSAAEDLLPPLLRGGCTLPSAL
mmetsp:Transcript_6502/g.20918  ORF Transcript_6502/g.20918 Transcript_6502/m.20918 type:complete len:356 (-) Transcript_6502:2047-3114(-)